MFGSRPVVPFLSVLLLAALGIFPASATSVTITNPGFETPFNTSTFGPPTGWTVIGSGSNVGAYNPYQFQGGGQYYVGATSALDPHSGGAGAYGIGGSMLAFVFGTSAGSGFSQTLSATLQPNTAYTLTVTEFQRFGTGLASATTAGSLIQLLAGSTVIASATDNTGPGAAVSADQVAFLANSNLFSGLFGQALAIRITTTVNGTSTILATDWDNVRLDATVVPEPTTIALVSAALVLATFRRRKQ